MWKERDIEVFYVEDTLKILEVSDTTFHIILLSLDHLYQEVLVDMWFC